MPDSTDAISHALPLRQGDFEDLAQALDYAARSDRGFHFYDARGRLTTELSYRDLRTRALAFASALESAGLVPGDRVAVIGETGPDFPTIFFACQYAGLVPVALPISLNLGGRTAYVEQLRGLLEAARPAMAFASEDFLSFLEEAAAPLSGIRRATPGAFAASGERAASGSRPAAADTVSSAKEIGNGTLVSRGIHDAGERERAPAYIQFTSGSTRFPRGVVVSQRAAMNNLRHIVRDGLKVRPGDRSVSWLPYYHDMGLVGFLLGPLVSQIDADYLSPQDFARRPVQWLKLLSRNGGTIAFGPPIGYQICEQRIRDDDLEGMDLSGWRIAGVGAETVRREPLMRFARRLRPVGFDPATFLPSYGLAEATLAVTFPPLGTGIRVDRVDLDLLSNAGEARPPADAEVRTVEVVNCGHVFPEHELAVRDDRGRVLGPRQVGRITVRGPSVMDGYFECPSATAEVLDAEGWLDTGDLGYFTEDGVFITGRRKDLIIIHGRNIWPQDLEALAESQPQVRAGDASAFGVEDPEGEERVVLVVQTRVRDEGERESLASAIQADVYAHFGIHCFVDLVPPHTLPKTSSGKLSRAAARRGFLERVPWESLHTPA
ncbi:MAG: AMP-binding protein [Gemmatimonadota bacterium]